MTVGSLVRCVGVNEADRSGGPPRVARHARDTDVTDPLRNGCARQLGDACRSLHYDVCPTCGFRPPRRLEAISRLHDLTEVWCTVLGDDASDVRRVAAYARDELHAVANRVQLLIEQPGIRLASLRIGVPSIAWSTEQTRLLIALLDDASQRLARLSAGLRADQWTISGSIGTSTVSVAGLIAVPLHTAHREVARHAVGADIPATSRCSSAPVRSIAFREMNRMSSMVPASRS